MQSIRQDFQVKFSYPVHFTTQLFTQNNPLFREVAGRGAEDLPKRVLFTIDIGVIEHHPHLIAEIEGYCRTHQSVLTLVRRPMLLPGGEEVKSQPRHVTAVQEAINDAGLCRHSLVVAVGGGAFIDMAGYAAATAHRGVRLIRVPTTVLSQSDSGVGVKNSINAFGKKNFIGTFAPPFAVLNDFGFLPTLSDRDWRSGMAEAVKVSLIKDAGFFDFIERRAPALREREMSPMRQLIYRCAQLHLDHIATSGDPFEVGSSRPLDFGHWAAHKLEQLTGYELRHGEAVAIGMALDSTYSYLAGLLDRSRWERILNVLSRLGLKLFVPEMSRELDQRDNPRSILGGLREFQEHLGGQFTVMLLQEIGQGIETHQLDEGRIRESVSILESRSAGG